MKARPKLSSVSTLQDGWLPAKEARGYWGLWATGRGISLVLPMSDGLDTSGLWGNHLVLAQGCFSPQVTWLDRER